MQYSQKCIDLVKKCEGYARKLANGDCEAYPDVGSRDGEPITIGYGTTRYQAQGRAKYGRAKVSLGDRLTQEQADAELSKALNSDSAVANQTPSEKIAECGNVKLKEPPQVVIDAMRKWGIKTPLQKAHFLAQCAHESGNFIYTKEIWGPSGAQQRYEGRRDLGNTQPGDGYRFAGRGYIQVTGRANYSQFRKGVTDDVVANSTLVEKKYVAETACWFPYTWVSYETTNTCDV